MKRCILHFGMHKTGSTSIQQTLCHAPAGSLPFTYVRPADWVPANLSDLVGAVWSDDPARHHVNKKLGLSVEQAYERRDKLRQSLTDSVRSITGTGLISAEGMYTLSRKGLEDFSKWLEAFAETVSAVGYIRPPKSMMESGFQQKLKGGAEMRLVPRTFVPRYRRRMEKFDLIFGRENTSFWKFAPSEFPEGDVVRDFCARLGFSIDPQHIQRRNEALSVNAVRMLFAYRRYGPGFGSGRSARGENDRLVRRLGRLSGPKFRLAADLVTPILKKRRHDIEWAEQRMGASLHEEVVDTPDAVRSEEDLLKFDENSLRWLAEQLGPDHVRRVHSAMTPEDVAGWVHELRLKLPKDNPAGPRRKMRAQGPKRNRPARQAGGSLAADDLC